MPLRGTRMVSPKVHAADRRKLNESAGIPEVLFLIPAKYLPLIINEISNIVELVLPRLLILECFHYRPRHNAYFELFCQLLISVQKIVPLRTEGKESRVFGHPVCEMIFGEDGEVGTFRSGGSYEVGRFGEIVRRVEGLGGDDQFCGREDGSDMMDVGGPWGGAG